MSIINKIWVRAKRKSRYLWGDIRHATGLDKALHKNARGSRIVLYHGICKTAPTRFNTLFITEQTFEEHLKFYTEHFNVVSLDDFYAGRFSGDKFNICFTFDDGFANNYNYVLPFLSKYKVPATFFITAIRDAGFDILWNDFLSIAGGYGPQKFTFKYQTYHKNRHRKYVDNKDVSIAASFRATGFNEKAALISFLEPLVNFKNNKHNDDYWQQMTVEQIKALSTSPYVTIGTHGYYHNDLAQIPVADAVEEMVLSKQYLENIAGKAITRIAFPYGSYNQQVLMAAKEAGYQQLLATDFINADDGADLYMRERFAVNPFISIANQMNAIIKGSYE